ncbi:MAG: sulfotransferase [Acidimicrobiia bacterium]|nr:sulfotransferase [Acidimicrobiia bacterium]
MAEKYQESDILWIFGHPRSGTTWMAKLLADWLDSYLWNEPGIGHCVTFRNNLERNDPLRLDDPTFWFSTPLRNAWQPALNSFFHDIISRCSPEHSEDGYLLIKEPNSSYVAPLIAEIMPKSKIIVMIRDPRDVTASLIDARRPGSWMAERLTTEFDRNQIVRQTVGRFQNLGVKLRDLREQAAPGQLYEMHYERLRADTESQLRHLSHVFGLEVDDERLAAAIKANSYENVPVAERGPGQFVRNAKVGGWANELTGDEIEFIETNLRRFLSEHGYLEERATPATA